MDEHNAGVDQGTKGSGNKILLACGGCCLLAFVGLAVGLYVAVEKGKSFALEIGANALTTTSRQMFQDLELPDDDVQAAMAPIEAFAKKIRNQEVSVEQALGVTKAILEGPVMGLVMSQGFEAKHLRSSGLSDDEKQAGHVTTSRFAHGIATDAISRARQEDVLDTLMEVKNNGGQAQRQFKQSLTDEELRETLALMQEAADDAGIADGVHEIDMATEIGEAIQYGMDNPETPN